MDDPQIIKQSVVFDDYLSKQQEALKPGLIELRGIIMSVAPNADEVFSYQVHCFKHIYMLVGIGVTKDACSFYTTSAALIKSMQEELKGFKISGTTIHFKPGQLLPVDAIKSIVATRILQNEALALKRKKKG